MSQQTNEVLKQFLSPAFILQVITLIVVAVVTFSKLDTRVSTVENRVVNLENLRIEDQGRLNSRLESIDRSLSRIVDWQLKQSK